MPRAFFEKTQHLFFSYERFLSPAALFAGFVIDSLTLRRIDLLYGNVVLFTYLIVAGAGIALVQLYKNEVITGRLIDSVAFALPPIIQFAFGGLFSGYFIFYSRSAAIATSWLFMLVLLSLLVGNEFFRKRYTRFVFQVSIFYTALFSFAIFFVPVVAKTMGALMFILSGLLGLAAIGAFIIFLKKMMPDELRRDKRSLLISIGSIYLAMNALYFANIIPPIPLALKDVGVYHSVERIPSGGYAVVAEKRKWHEVSRWFVDVFHYIPGEPIYVYSAVFAPTRLDARIIHRWEYYDAGEREWVTANEVQYPIVGGRDGGYRGFSFKENVFPGLWRVDVVTERGQLIGRIKFVVTDAPAISEMQSMVL